jgi:hypothetical protein
MGKVIVKVVAGLAVLTYGAFFLSWNMAPQEVTGWQMMGTRYSQQVPLGALVFIGLVGGAVVMALAAWTAWAAQKATADRATAQVRKAKEKLQAQLDHIYELRAEIEQLENRLDGLAAGDGSWGQTSNPDSESKVVVVDDLGDEGDDDDII